MIKCPNCGFEIYTPINYNDKIAPNFILGESYSTQIINRVEYRRKIKPTIEYIPRVLIGAKFVQNVRDRLNEIYGGNINIGPRNSLNDIILLVASWWRTYEFQRWLFDTKQTTTTTGQHPQGLAIDLYTPRGMNSIQFRNFIRDKCNTGFTNYITYAWGVHNGFKV